jgi:hypothetical protein
LNKKVLGIAVILMAVAMVVLPMSVAFAEKPTEITGTLMMIDPISYMTQRDLGNSGNWISTFTNAPLEIHGGIEGTGVYTGHWLVKPIDTFPFIEVIASKGVYTLDVEVNGASGELTINLPAGNSKIVIVGGTGGLETLHGTGRMTMETPISYTYSMNVHFDP